VPATPPSFSAGHRLTASGGNEIGVASISIDPKWVDRSGRNLDAAVLRLKADAGVAPLSLASRGDTAMWPPGTLAWVLGWGQLNAKPSPGGDDFFADRLRQLQEPVQGDDACEGVFGIGVEEFPYIASRVLCAGTADGTSGTCFGDSGGPLVVATSSGPLDVGIVVGNTGCAARGYFDLYTRVDAIRSFALGVRSASQPDVVIAPRADNRAQPRRSAMFLDGRAAAVDAATRIAALQAARLQ